MNLHGIEFPDGDFYSCTDPEQLAAEDPWSAIEEVLDPLLTPKMTVAEVEAEVSSRPVTVTVYIPMPVSDSQIQIWADSLTENLDEMFRDEHGNPEDDTVLCADAEKIMREAVAKIVKASHVWQCQDVAYVKLTGEQVLMLAKKEAPYWFEERGGTGDARGTRGGE